MTESNSESKQVGIPDEELPADLVPDADNPLAEGLPDGETVEGLLTEGKDGDDDDGESDEPAYAPAEGSGTDGEQADPPPPEESAAPQER